MTTLVFSVHADDAVFSAGEFIARQVKAGEDVIVLSICSRWPQGDAEGMRWQCNLNSEHYDACRSLGAFDDYGSFLDGKWQSEVPKDALDKLWHDVTALGVLFTSVLVPLGIHHPDHLFFAPLCLEVAQRLGGRTAIYEDLPYRAMYPEETCRRREEGIYPLHAELESAAGGGFYDEKLAACKLYDSQWDEKGDSGRCCMVPERIWWLS